MKIYYLKFFPRKHNNSAIKLNLTYSSTKNNNNEIHHNSSQFVKNKEKN